MGTALALPFLFDALNSLITTAVYDETKNLPLPWYIGCAFWAVSVLCGWIICTKVIGKENQSRNQELDE